jgi:hypothetical protein
MNLKLSQEVDKLLRENVYKIKELKDRSDYLFSLSNILKYGIMIGDTVQYDGKIGIIVEMSDMFPKVLYNSDNGCHEMEFIVNINDLKILKRKNDISPEIFVRRELLGIRHED